jgi:hypothetical protein
MRILVNNRANSLGALSVALLVSFCVFGFWNVGPKAFNSSPLGVLVPLAILLAVTISAMVAAWLGSKWWLLVLICPVVVLAGVLLQWLMH